MMKVTKGKILISILPDEKVEKKIGELVIPGGSIDEGTERAKVIEANLSEDENFQIQTGDNLLIYKGSGKEFTSPEDQEKYRVINVSEIIVAYGK